MTIVENIWRDAPARAGALSFGTTSLALSSASVLAGGVPVIGSRAPQLAHDVLVTVRELDERARQRADLRVPSGALEHGLDRIRVDGDGGARARDELNEDE